MQNAGITVYTPDPFQVTIFGGIIILIVVCIVAIGVWVYKIGFPEIEKGQTRKPQLGVIILVILAILSPEAISILTDAVGTQFLYVIAMWLNTIGITLAGYSFNTSFLFIAIPLTLLRLGYPTMVYRYYRSMTSRRYVIITGVLVELPALLFGIPLLILFIVGLLIL